MLSGSTILRVAALVVAAAVLAGLVQRFWPHADGVPEPQVATAPAAPTPRVIRPADPPPAPAPAPGSGMAGTQAPPAPQPAPVQAPVQPAPPSDITQGPVLIRPQAARPAPTVLSEVPPVAAEPSGEGAAADAADSAGPRALGSVDLNSASVADLNGLRGGGMIGKAIVQKRPYASVGELLSKRVLSRATYERIKDQVTVR